MHLLDYNSRMLTALLVAALGTAPPLPDRIVNPGFEDGMRGWAIVPFRGLRADVAGNPGYGSDHAAEGRFWLTGGWVARNGAPPGAEMRVTTRLNARRYRGRTIRVSAMTRAPDFASSASSLFVRSDGMAGAGPEARTPIVASDGWRRQSVDLLVPRDAGSIELGFILEGTSAQLDADAVRVEVRR